MQSHSDAHGALPLHTHTRALSTAAQHGTRARAQGGRRGQQGGTVGPTLEGQRGPRGERTSRRAPRPRGRSQPTAPTSRRGRPAGGWMHCASPWPCAVQGAPCASMGALRVRIPVCICLLLCGLVLVWGRLLSVLCFLAARAGLLSFGAQGMSLSMVTPPG